MSEGVAAVREELDEASSQAEARTAPRTHEEKPREAVDARCSVDPMHPTDRYRLVTPYVGSSRDL